MLILYNFTIYISNKLLPELLPNPYDYIKQRSRCGKDVRDHYTIAYL